MPARTHRIIRTKYKKAVLTIDQKAYGTTIWRMMYCAQDPDREMLYRKETQRRKEDRKKRGGRKSPENEVYAGDSYLYVAYNLHWEKRQLALPYLPSGREWHVVIDTSIDRFSLSEKHPETIQGGHDDRDGKAKCVELPGRSIRVLVG